MSKAIRRETAWHMWDIVLSWFRVCRLKHLNDMIEVNHRLNQKFGDAKRTLEDLTVNGKADEPACCATHATPLQRMSQMIVCPECGDKRCNKAQICRLECNDPSDTKPELFT